MNKCPECGSTDHQLCNVNDAPKAAETLDLGKLAAELRAAAERAPRSPWWIGDGCSIMASFTTCEGETMLCEVADIHGGGEDMAKYLLAAQPACVLALLDSWGNLRATYESAQKGMFVAWKQRDYALRHFQDLRWSCRRLIEAVRAADGDAETRNARRWQAADALQREMDEMDTMEMRDAP